MAIEDIDLDGHRPFDCYPGTDNRPGVHTFFLDSYRRDDGRFRVIHGSGGEAEAVEYGLSLLHLLLAFRERRIAMDLRAVDVRDRIGEVEDAAGLTRYDR